MSAPRVAAHLIVGSREEPFLDALLASLEGVVDCLIVNDNAPDPSPHTQTLARSWFGAHGWLAVDRAPFADFSTARNRCLELHARLGAGDWVAFVDADEVHGEAVARIARNLERVPPQVDFVDGYTWHFFQSFGLYTSIERRMSFFRYAPGVRWSGSVHEQLTGLHGARVALPYVYGHYGHVLPVRWHAEKGRLYSRLGQPGATLAEDELDAIDLAHYFRTIWPRVLRFHGTHPRAAWAAIERLRPLYARDHAQAIACARAAQPPLTRARNRLMQVNYELRWRGRVLSPLARQLMAG